MHHLDSNQMTEENIDGNCTRMMGAVLNRSWKKHTTAADQVLTSYLTNHSRWAKYAKHCWWNKDGLLSKILEWTHTHGHASVGWPVKTYIHQLSADLQRAIDDRDRRQEGDKGIHVVGTYWWWWWWWYLI